MIKVAFNGLLLNGPFTVGNIRRPLPEFRVASSTVDGADGDVFEGQTVGPRRVLFDILATGGTDAELQDAARTLLGALLVRRPVPLTFSDEVEDKYQLVRYAVPTGAFDAKEFRRMGRWSCELVQPDPYLYGKPRSVVIEAGKTVAVDAGGNAPAWPVASAAVTGDHYLVRIPGGQGVRFAAAFTGEKVTVDMGRMTVRTSSPVEGDGLQIGSRFFALSGTTKVTASHRTTIEWRERWI